MKYRDACFAAIALALALGTVAGGAVTLHGSLQNVYGATALDAEYRGFDALASQVFGVQAGAGELR